MKVFITTIGCEQRRLEEQRIINWLKCDNHIVCESPADADYAIIITCGVDISNSRRSFEVIKEIKKKHKR